MYPAGCAGSRSRHHTHSGSKVAVIAFGVNRRKKRVTVAVLGNRRRPKSWRTGTSACRTASWAKRRAPARTPARNARTMWWGGVALGDVRTNGRTSASFGPRPIRSAKATKSANPPKAVTGLSVKVIPIALEPSNGVT